MIKTISRTNDTIIVIDDKGTKTARADHPKWTELCDLYNRISYVPNPLGENGVFIGPITELLAMMDLKQVVEDYTVGLLSVTALGVTYAGRVLHSIDAERVMSFMRDKLSYKSIANYISRKMKNPSSRAIKEMYNFLEHKGMPLTLKGTFIAYKGVTTDLWSIKGNKETVVLQGQVDSQGRILNTIGATIEVERSSVDDDFRVGCSTGLHVGSLAYAKDWGRRIVLVEVDPADVVSVPDDCNCQKLRCCKYTVVGEYTGPMPDTLTTEFDSANDDENDNCHQCGNPIDDCNCRHEQSPLSSPEETHVAKTKDENAISYSGVNQRVVSILAEYAGVDKSRLTSDMKVSYDSLGLDSLDAVEICMALEEEFGFEISDEVLEKYTDSTVGQIVNDITYYLLKHNLPIGSTSVPSQLTEKQSYDIGFSDGRQQRAIDRGMNIYTPAYRADDVDGSDSDAHANYIRGYIAGYEA